MTPLAKLFLDRVKKAPTAICSEQFIERIAAETFRGVPNDKWDALLLEAAYEFEKENCAEIAIRLYLYEGTQH